MKNFENPSTGANMEKLKFMTVLQFGQWPQQKMNTVPQIDSTTRGMPCLTCELICCKCEKQTGGVKVDVPTPPTRVARSINEVAKLDKTSMKKLVQK